VTGRTPIRELGRRAPEQGRIRTGKTVTKTGKKGEYQAPERIEAFRFSSTDEAAIYAIAEQYGGTAQVWDGAPGRVKQWEVYTPLARVPVALPVDCLGDGVVYEWWQGGYCARRCDGETCAVPQDTPDGTEMVDGPCLCAQEKGKAKCSGKLRLNVVLTDIKPFGGTWRLETSSEHALRELPGMVDMILAMQDVGVLSAATLVLDQRSKVKWVKGKPQTQNYGVPMLAIPHSLDGLMSGAAQLGTYNGPSAAIGSGPSPAQGPDSRGGGDVPGKSIPADVTPDDEVAEAEIVDTISDDQHEALRDAADVVATAWNGEHPEEELTAAAILQAAAGMMTGKPDQRVAELDVEHGKRMGTLLDNMIRGDVAFDGIRGGRIKSHRVKETT
jgi:hypothetical protein